MAGTWTAIRSDDVPRPRLIPSLGDPGAWIWFLKILAVYAAVDVNFATQYYLGRLHGANHRPWLTCLGEVSSTWISWALVTPIIGWFAKRWPLEPGQRFRSLKAHLLGLTIVAPVQVGLDFAIVLFLEAAFGIFSLDVDQLLQRAPDSLMAGVLDAPQMYAVILGIFLTVDYYHRYRDRELRASHLEKQLAQTQLQVLRMQLHPHFLFNTLHAVSSLMHRDAGKAEQMLARLAELLRSSLESDGQEVPLEREMELLRRYVDIERVRFSDRLEVKYEVQDGALDACVPSFILQPLAENAIRHGIAPRSSQGLLRIEARREKDRLKLSVRDNGVGLLRATPRCEGAGVGLSNTRERLMQLYGDSARMRVQEAAEGGAEVLLDLPYRPWTEAGQSGAAEHDDQDHHRGRRTAGA